MSKLKLLTNNKAVTPPKKVTNKTIKVIVGVLVSMLVLLVILSFSFLPRFHSLEMVHAAAASTTDSSSSNTNIKMTKQESFIDSHNRLNVIGVVDNNGNVPISVTVSLHTIDKSGVIRTLTDPTFGNIIYPFTGAPFKFIFELNQSVKGTAFISSVRHIPVPYYNVIRLDYSNMPAANSSNKALVGTVQNIGPFDLHDVSVYASVHDRKGIQIDSVKSNVISLLKPGQEAHFIALPDYNTAPNIYYYSCAGMSLGNDPMTTLDIGKGHSILYDINGVVRISDFKYNTTNDSIMFGVKHYNPNGGPMSLKLVKSSGYAAMSVMMDGKIYHNNTNGALMKMTDPKTMHIDLFIPSGDHTVQIKGIRSAA
jgi:hypothetical protein